MLYQIKAATTDVSVVIRIVDSTDGTPETGVVFDTAGIDLQYRREGAASTAITEATLAALTTAHTDGGFLHIGNGYYRLDLPDAACATGVTGVLVHGTVTGMVVIGCYIQLVAYDPFDTVRLGLTALPNAAADAAGGLPISDAGGLDLDAQIGTDIDAILVDTAVIGAAGAGLTEAGGTGDHLTAVPWNAAWDAEVESEATDALNAYDPPTKAELDTAFDLISDDGTAIFDRTTDSLQAIRDRGDAAWITGGGGTAPTAGEVADAVWDEALAGHVTAGSYGKSVADIESDATAILEDTAVIGALGAGLTAIPWNAAWDAEVQSEVADALAVYDPPTAAEMDARTLLAASYATAASITALNDIAASDILTASLTEAVAAEGVSPTVQQALVMLLAVLGVYKASRSGTTITVFGADETTALMTYTVDDATTPTSVTRAS